MDVFFLAFESALVMFPVTLLTVTIFRNVRPRPSEDKLLRQWEKAVDANFNKFKASTKASSSRASLATSELESSSILSKPSTDGEQRDAKQTDGMYTPKSSDSSKLESASMLGNKPSDNSSGSSVYTSKSPESSESKQTDGMYTPKSSDSSKPESASKFSKLVKWINPSSKKSPESSKPETSSVHSEPSTRIDDMFYSEGSDGMYTPMSTFTLDQTSGTVPSATSISDGNLTEEASFQSVIEGDLDVEEKVLPWWTVYISWTLVMCVSFTFSFLIILYCFEFGANKSIQWLKVVILSFLTGILIQEPLKVITIAIVVALIFKRSEEIQISNSDSITEDSVRGKGFQQFQNVLVFEE